MPKAPTWHLEQGLSKMPAPIAHTPNRNGSATPMQLTLPTAVMTGNLCPQCGSSTAFVMEEGCKKCHSFLVARCPRSVGHYYDAWQRKDVTDRRER